MSKKNITPKKGSNYTMDQVNAVQFAANKNYQWAEDTQFVFSGKEFEYTFNEMLNFINAPFSVQGAIRMANLYNMLETKFKVGILDGTIKEISAEAVQKLIDEANAKKEQSIEFEEVLAEQDIPVEG